MSLSTELSLRGLFLVNLWCVLHQIDIHISFFAQWIKHILILCLYTIFYCSCLDAKQNKHTSMLESTIVLVFCFL